MPLTKSGSDRAFKSNVSTLMGEVGKSPKVQSKDQALRIAYEIKRRGKADGGAVTKSPIFRSADLAPTPVEADPELAFDPFARAAFRQRTAARLRRAAGGEVAMPAIEDPGPLHEGPVVSDVPGRTDKHNIRVKAGSYVLPSSHVASLAQDNTIGGFSVLDKMFKKQGNVPKLGPMRGPRRRRADGGMVPDDPDVPIVVAGGEYILNPEQVLQVGNGDIKRGHEVLDAWVKSGRKKHIATLRRLPGPAKT